MSVRNNTHIYVVRTSNNRVILSDGLYCYLLPQCEALHTSCSGFPIITLPVRNNVSLYLLTQNLKVWSSVPDWIKSSATFVFKWQLRNTSYMKKIHYYMYFSNISLYQGQNVIFTNVSNLDNVSLFDFYYISLLFCFLLFSVHILFFFRKSHCIVIVLVVFFFCCTSSIIFLCFFTSLFILRLNIS